MAEGKTRLRYVGPHDEAEVVDPADGTVHLVQRDKEKPFPTELADALLEQETNWARASSGAQALTGGDPTEALREAHQAATRAAFEPPSEAEVEESAPEGASKAAAKLAADNGIDLDSVEGSGKSGQITKDDVQALIDAGTATDDGKGGE